MLNFQTFFVKSIRRNTQKLKGMNSPILSKQKNISSPQARSAFISQGKQSIQTWSFARSGNSPGSVKNVYLTVAVGFGETLVYRVNYQIQPFQRQSTQEDIVGIRDDRRLQTNVAIFPADFHRLAQAVLRGGTVGEAGVHLGNDGKSQLLSRLLKYSLS
jgi:hypothetical protein